MPDNNIQLLSDRDATIGLDSDGDGFVDGTTHYKLFRDGLAVDLTNRNGRNFSHSTSSLWNATKAIVTDNGFQVLLQGSSRFNGRFRIWDVNSAGILTSFSRWTTTSQAIDEGWESLFGDIIQPDGIIGNPDTAAPLPASDADGDGFVDGTTHYKLFRDGLAVDLTNRNGRNFSHSTSSLWNATKAIVTDNGFQVLLQGSSRFNGRFRIWDVNSAGILTSFSRWTTTSQAIDEGWESLFGDIIQPDGIIGNPDTAAPLPASDADGDGFVDGTTHYKLFRDGLAVDLTNRNGRNFSHSTSSLWNATKAIVTDNGFQVLLQGSSRFNGRFRIWDVNSAGILTSFSRWTTTSQAIDEGWESLFGDIIQPDGIIGNPDTAAPPPTPTPTPSPTPTSVFNSVDGYGQVNASAAFEELLGIDLPDSPSLGGNNWNLDNLNVPEVWAGVDGFAGVKGAGATIAVIDTGIDLDHPEFSNRLVAGYDFVDNDTDPDDIDGHGTHVAGTIAGRDDDNTGISGVAPAAKIMPIRVLDNEGEGWNSDIVAGIRWAVDNGADVINLSLGGDDYSRSMEQAIRYANERGSVVVMASGNEGKPSPNYPAAHAANYGIAVGAVDRNQNFADFSNQAGRNTLDYVTAPGVSIYSAVPDGRYDYYSGTSMATPHVAGLAALLKSHDKSLTPAAIENLLTRTAQNSNSSRRSDSNVDSVTGQIDPQTITLDTITNFNNSQLSTRIIGHINGDLSSRKLTIKDLKHDFKHNKIIDEFEVISSTHKSLLALDLSDSQHLDQASIVKNWLERDLFNYLEFDTRFSAI